MQTVNLYELYDEFNREFFNGSLPGAPEVTVEWSSRLTSSAGLCRINKKTKKKTIRISTHYHEKFPDDIEATLLHEMIHIKVPNHSKEFYKELERIKALGGNVSRYSRERAVKQDSYKWHYQCTGCSNSFYRVRRLSGRHVCAFCRSRFIESPV